MIKISIPSSLLITLIFLAAISASSAQSADQELVTKDGREILLKEDGTWSYRSTDRFANTKDGQRVRLKEDGSWSYAGNAPLKLKEQVRTIDLDIKLQKVVIETYEKKVQKNTRVKTQTVFYLNLVYTPLDKTTIELTRNDITRIEVKDNNGKSYPVLSVRPIPVILKPDTKTTLVIRAEKSPSIWDDVRSMQITFKQGVFGLKEPVTLSQFVDDFDETKVDGFEKK